MSHKNIYHKQDTQILIYSYSNVASYFCYLQWLCSAPRWDS